jgi:hypothetical protein
MDIETVMKRLYESEINCSIGSFWDNGWDVKLGDEMNGFVAEGNFHTLDEAADFLDSRSAEALCRIGVFARQVGAWPTRGHSVECRTGKVVVTHGQNRLRGFRFAVPPKPGRWPV